MKCPFYGTYSKIVVVSHLPLITLLTIVTERLLR